MSPITISATGVCVLDLLFNDVDLSSEAIKPYLSRTPGDGGIEPGKMTLGESLEKYSGNRNVQALLKEICGKSEPDYTNLGGVAIATLVHASQLLDHHNFELYYYGSIGDDGIGDKVRSMISRTQVKHDSLSPSAGKTCSTIVLSDPIFSAGQGERSFIYFPNRMRYSRTNLDKRFFSSDITLFAGTENYPDIYENFTSLLKQCKENGCVTFVETSYDSYSESKNPGQKWIMGDSDECYHYIDILAMNRDEALKHSGTKNFNDAVSYFKKSGTSSFIITRGPHPIYFHSNGKLCQEEEGYMPVSKRIVEELDNGLLSRGDTVGCGDNFVGGVLASVASQMQYSKNSELSLPEACAWGVVSGAFSLTHIGGVYLEKTPGEKKFILEAYYESYREQIDDLKPGN